MRPLRSHFLFETQKSDIFLQIFIVDELQVLCYYKVKVDTENST